MLKRIELRQLPWDRLVEVKRTFLNPNSEKKMLLKKRNERKLEKKHGRFRVLRWKSRRNINLAESASNILNSQKLLVGVFTVRCYRGRIEFFGKRLIKGIEIK